MGRTRKEMLEEAEAEVRQAGEELSERESALAEAEGRLDAAESESWETDEELAEITARINAADEEVTRLKEGVAEASDDFRRAADTWESYSRGGEDDDDDDSGESLSIEDAADIWMSNGMDSDYSSGFAEDELRRASGMD